MVAREPPEREWQRRVAARVVQRMTCLVEERLVVVEAALGARDQVHDARRVGGDDARARRLLRAILEIGADPLLRVEIEAERAERREADLDASLLRVRGLERREPADPRHVRDAGVSSRSGPSRRSSQRSRCGVNAARALDPRLVDGVEDRPERDALLVLVARNGIGDARDVGLELVASGEQRAPLVVERRGDVEHRLTERVAACVLGLDREPSLRRPERQLVAVPRHPGGEQRVLERVLPRGELAVDDAVLAREPQPGDRLARRRPPRPPRPRGAPRAARA